MVALAARGSELSARRGSEPSARPVYRFVARGNKPSARQGERSGKRGCGGGSPHLPCASLPAVVNRLQDKPSAAESGGVGAAAPSGKHFVARGSEPHARQAERRGKGGFGGGSLHLPSASLPAVVNRLQDKPSAAESGGVGAAAPTCDSKILKVGYTAVTIRESVSARRLALPPNTQLLSNVGVHTSEYHFFDSAEH